jgi:hypothetical protein
VAPFTAPRTAVAPGIQPLDPADWLFPQDDFAGQMAERDRLILEHPRWAFATLPEGREAAEELLEAVLADVLSREGYAREGDAIRRPDGVRVALEDLPPVATAGRLAQEDFLLMLKPEGAAEHVLVAGVLCFPAQWTLAEKIGRPLLRIHKPVPEYPGDLERRVQRFFDGVKPGRPLWRANWHFASEPDIVTPAREAEKMANYRNRLSPGEDAWLRVERQTVLRLPRTGTAVFGVRTLMSPASALTPEQWRALEATLHEIPEDQGARKLSPALRARAAREAAKAPA